MILNNMRLPTLFKVISSTDEITKMEVNSPQFIALVDGTFLGQPSAKQLVMRRMILDFMETVYNGHNIPNRGDTNRFRWHRSMTEIQRETLDRYDINVVMVRAGMPPRMYGSVVQGNVSLAHLIAMQTVVQSVVEMLEHPKFDVTDMMPPQLLRHHVGAQVQNTLSFLRTYRVVNARCPVNGYEFSEQDEARFVLRIGSLFVAFEFEGPYVRIKYDGKAREIIAANYGTEYVYDKSL